MLPNKKVLSVGFLLLVIVLSGCSMKSEENALQDAKESAKNIFEDKSKIETNHEIDSFSFYLPDNLEVTDETANNVILTDGDQTYIVFYNSLEDPLSELNYESAEDSKSLLYESFNDDKKFGYIQVLPEEEETYQIQVGVGGVKITTYITKGEMDNEAEELMKMARSIAEYEDNNDD